MSALAISLWFVLAVVAALRVTSRLADELGRPLAWTLGLLAGLGSSTLPHGLAIALGAAQAPLVLAVFASLALVWLLRPSERALVPTALLHHAQPHGLALRLAWTALGLSVLLALVAFRHRVLAHPDGEWDSWAIWTLRARFLARGGAQAGLGPEVEHPDYPLLLPLLTAQGLALPKLSSSPLPPIAAGFVFTALGPLALGLLVARLRGHVAGLLAASSLLLLPFWVRSGADLYADVPLATLALAAAGTLALALETDSLRLLPLAGLFAGLAAWTKNEGALVLLGGVAALTLPLLRASTRSPRRL
ncbi:MAG: glycosyltransferase family 39 protein, partial [Deltaproteobacteria bacterium]|nr:glycosyltransferase family 39 protein [Deltaproteobacteria bacterium]